MKELATIEATSEHTGKVPQEILEAIRTIPGGRATIFQYEDTKNYKIVLEGGVTFNPNSLARYEVKVIESLPSGTHFTVGPK